jgi:hypothetical protein
MVRAAATGAFNYANADPYDSQWRLRHLLVIREVTRQANESLLTAAHNYWCAYVSHSNLDADSWANAKEHAADTLTDIQSNLFPWIKTEENKSKKDTIDAKYGDLIASYRRLVASKAAKAAEQPPKPPGNE